MTETTTLTLTGFLLARIAEDEVDAEASLDRGFGGWEWLADLGVNFEARTHIVRHHPARVLAECEAKRRIVEYHEDAWGTNIYTEWGRNMQGGLRFAVQQMAVVYADHPDYRPEWRP